MTPDADYDCLIIGGGPAGLTGALYLARFHRRVLVIDEGKSRAAGIPKSHNHPGFPDGISGDRLIAILRAQAEKYGAIVASGTVLTLAQRDGGFVASTTLGTVHARRILMATGIVDRRPGDDILNAQGDMQAVRYCPVCDGFEATDKQIAVYGPTQLARAKAVFLRTYSRDVTIIPEAANGGESTGVNTPPDPEISWMLTPVTRLEASDDKVDARLQDGQSARFDVLYPAMGCHVNSQLATALGAATNDAGCLVVDDKQKTTVAGIYAAGDVVSDLHQLVVAEGHAAIAATAIHNDLPRNFRS